LFFQFNHNFLCIFSFWNSAFLLCNFILSFLFSFSLGFRFIHFFLSGIDSFIHWLCFSLFQFFMHLFKVSLFYLFNFLYYSVIRLWHEKSYCCSEVIVFNFNDFVIRLCLEKLSHSLWLLNSSFSEVRLVYSEFIGFHFSLWKMDLSFNFEFIFWFSMLLGLISIANAYFCLHLGLISKLLFPTQAIVWTIDCVVAFRIWLIFIGFDLNLLPLRPWF
jgi:hypothetical protein